MFSVEASVLFVSISSNFPYKSGIFLEVIMEILNVIYLKKSEDSCPYSKLVNFGVGSFQY